MKSLSTASRNWLGAVALVIMTLAVYWPARRAGFIWDDDSFLTGNPLIKQANGLLRFWFSTDAVDYFPMTSTTLWLEWRLWGMNAAGYHIVNIILHGLGAVLLWRVIVKLNIPGAWLAAALFAVHPVNVESVAWITQRKNTLAMFFFAASLWFYLRLEETGRRRFYALALAAFALALLSKTSVAPLPFVLLGIAWWRRGRIGRNDLVRSAGFFALALVVGLISVWFQYNRAIGATPVRTDGILGRTAGAGWALWFYLWKALLPIHLIFVYPRWEIAGKNPLSWAPLALWAAGLWVCWRWRGSWGKPALFAFGYFTVMLLPVLGFLSISYMMYSLAADHWQYLAILGPLALVAAGLHLLSITHKWISWTTQAALLVLLGALAWRQAHIYLDAETLWRATLAGNPGCWMADENLAELDLQSGHADEAMPLLQNAMKLHPKDHVACNDLAYAYLLKGDLPKAVEYCRQAIAARPDDAKARYNLGRILLLQRHVAEAANQLEKAVEIEPSLWAAQDKLGEALMHLGRTAEAVVHFQKSLEIKPDNFTACLNLAGALAQTDQPREAADYYEKAIALRSDQPGALNDFAWLLATSSHASVRNGTRALELAQRAETLSGGKDPGIADTMAAAYAEAGKFPEAVAAAQHALELARAQNSDFAGKIEAHVRLYQSGAPLRAGP